MDSATTIIDAQADIEGTLRGKDAQVLGRFRGQIDLTGRLVLGEGAKVDAKVTADAVEIAGEFKGELKARSLSVLEKGRVEGTHRRPAAGHARGRAAQRLRERGRRPAGAAGQHDGVGHRVILRELADRLGCVLRGDGGVEVHRVSGIEDSGPGDLTFVANPRYVPRLATTRASAVILSPDLQTPLPEPRLPQPVPRLRAGGGDPPSPGPARARGRPLRPRGPDRPPGSGRARRAPGRGGSARARRRAHA